MNQDGLPSHEMSVVEQSLPCGQPGNRQCSSHRVVDAGRQRCKVTGLYRDVLRERAIAGPIGDPEDSLADRQPCGAITHLGNDSGQFVPGNGRAPVAPGAVGPRSRPVKLPWGEARRMHPHDHIVLCRVRVGHFG